MTEALVSLYRLNSKGIAINPFPSLLGPNAADSSKLTAIYAALTLIREVSFFSRLCGTLGLES